MRILAAMSGGVDSSVAALRLQQQGHEVVGVFFRNGVTAPAAAQAGGAAPAAAHKSCCSVSDARDAALVCDRLGIPFYSVDYQQEFGALIDHFAAEYRRGRTPNPCVLCNQQLKFGHVFELAQDLGADGVATGHYARRDGDALRRPVDRNKDQTYYLFGIDRAVLPRVHFPLGDLPKDEVRALAAQAGLRTAQKPESMEICFVTSGDYRDVVRARGGAGRPGRIVDGAGREVGRHDGVDGFTVGQRRGLPALGTPHYVAAIDPDSGDVTVRARAGLETAAAAVQGVRWLVEPPATGERLRASVQVRARSAAAAAELEVRVDGGVAVTFAEPVFAVTPGQAAVFYDGDRVLGGGWLD
ncbi:MAG: tRNA 2-thiouridine(34) synthase MnmA [Planctomycetota bacterium]